MVVPARVVLGSTAWWELALAILVMLAGIAAMVRLAAVVYARAILRTGAPAKLRRVLRGATS